MTGRAAAVAVLHDPENFTVDDPRFSTARVVGRSMLSTDGAEHARHRAPFTGPFRRRVVEERFTPFVTSTVGRLLGRVHGHRGAELRAELAGPLAAATVAESLGLDGRDDAVVDRLLGWYREIVRSVAGVAEGRPLTAAGGEAMAALRRALEPVIAGSRGGSLLADAVAAGGPTADEAVSDAAVIMFGGIETTEAMILNALWFVLRDTAVRNEVLTSADLVAPAVEESLRLEPAAAVVDRYATRGVEIGGAAIRRGDLVVVSLAGANRDPSEFPDPDRFELRRPNARRHLAFAVGPHVCVGMELARIEATLALQAVLTTLGDVRLGDDVPPPTGLVFRKPARLPVHWT